MKPVILALAAFALADFGPASAQQASPAGNAANGKTLYVQVGCYQCHGLAGQGAVMTGPAVLRTAYAFDGFLAQLRRPTNQMPPYEAAILSDQEAADIYVYLKGMPAPRDPGSIPLLNAAR